MSAEEKAPEVAETSEGKEHLAQDQVDRIGDLHAAVKGMGSIADKLETLTRTVTEIQKDRLERNMRQPAPPPETQGTVRYLMDIVEYPNESDSWEMEVSQVWKEVKGLHHTFSGLAQAKGAPYGGVKDFKRSRHLDYLLKSAKGRWTTKADHWDTSTDTAGGGSAGSEDWIDIMYQSTYQDVYTLEPMIASAFSNRINMPQRAGDVRVPVATSETTVDVVAEQTSVQTGYLAATTGPNTDYVNLVPVKHRAGIVMSTEFTEDAVVDAMGVARNIIMRDLALGLDDALLNGQATENDATFDSTNSSAPANGAVNGLRYFCHTSPGSNETSNTGAVLESNDVAGIRASMGKFGVRPSELRLIVGSAGYLNLIKDASDDRVTTLEKYGAGATILTGELARVWGIPVIVSDRMPENMNNTGDLATTSTLTGAILVNQTRWWLGIKRQFEIRVVPSPVHDQVGVYGFSRFAFDDAPPTTDNHTWYLYNIALA